MGRVSHHIDTAVIHTMLASPSGGLYKNMLKRAIRVQAQARKNLQRPPRRVDTGLLRASIYVKPIMFGGYPGFRIGTNVSYAIYVHNGTGLFGPKHHLITPTSAQVMVFKSKKTGKKVFTKHSKGMPANPFLKDALSAAKT